MYRALIIYSSVKNTRYAVEQHLTSSSESLTDILNQIDEWYVQAVNKNIIDSVGKVTGIELVYTCGNRYGGSLRKMTNINGLEYCQLRGLT